MGCCTLKHCKISVRNISYSTPAERILDNVSFDLYAGEILSIVGTNGVGKSLLGKIIAGLDQPENGRIVFDGEVVYPGTHTRELYRGIGYISESPKVIPNMTVAENLFIGHEKDRGIYLSKKRLNRMAGALLEEFGLNLDPNKKGINMDLNECSKLNIARQMMANPKLLIIDDLNCKFSENEIANLQRLFLNYTRWGGAIINISHNYSDMFNISDRVMVLKSGMIIYQTSKAEKANIREALYGREIKQIEQMYMDSLGTMQGEPVLELRNWSVGSICNLNLKLYRNEVLGIAGVYGSGKSDIIYGINGLRPVESGEMLINGKKTVIRSPRGALKNGIATCFENRLEMIFGRKAKATENVSVSSLGRVSKAGIIFRKMERVLAGEYLHRVSFGERMDKDTEILNSANIMKLALARCIATNPDILIIDEPNKELDIETLREIGEGIKKLKKDVSVILTFTKIDDLCNICDRMFIVDNGAVISETTHRKPETRQ